MSYTYFSSWPGAASPPDRLVDRMGWCLRGSIICEFHVAAYISRLPAVNHHNGVLIMEIIAQSVAVVVVAHCGRGIDRRMEWGLGRRAGPGRKEGQAASLLARKGGATTTSGLTLNCRNCGENPIKKIRNVPQNFIQKIVEFVRDSSERCCNKSNKRYMRICQNL